MSYTINPNAKNKWARNADNTIDLSLETDASSVYLDNGRTLEQEIGEGSMVSNVATVNSAMSKVIDGTLDGAYESLVFKGKSLVNLFDKSKIATNHPSYTVGTDNTISFVANNGFTDGIHLSHLKPNTKYALFFDVLTASQEPNIPYRINDDGTNYNINIFGQGQDNPTSGFHSFTTGSDVSNLKFFFYTNLRNVGFKLTLPVIIEYQDGMENWGIPYFDGIGYAKMPILRNVGKNLLNMRNVGIQGTYRCSATNNGDGVVTITGTGDGTGEGYVVFDHPIQLEKGKTYSFGFKSDGSYSATNGTDSVEAFLLKDAKTTAYQQMQGFKTVFTCHTSGVYYPRFDVNKNNTTHKFWDIQLEESPATTTYEDYKTNILRTSEEIVLREVGGVCDTYNPLTGEYVRRIGGVVFDGSSDENWNAVTISPWTENGYYTFEYLVQTSGLPTYDSNNGIYAICDKFNSITYNTARTDAVGILLYDSQGKKVAIKQKEYTTLNEWKQYLASNPITVQYQLATPITTIVESLTTPFAYQNGHIILESGYEGQSLLPTLEYSTVVNKTGQIENVAKTIQRQEKQLTILEQMLIQNIINLDYNNTLLTLKNEMEEML